MNAKVIVLTYIIATVACAGWWISSLIVVWTGEMSDVQRFVVTPAAYGLLAYGVWGFLTGGIRG